MHHNDVHKIAANILADPARICAQEMQKFLTVTCSDRGHSAQIDAIKICCNRFHEKELGFAKEAMRSLDDVKGNNIQSITPYVPMGPINFQLPDPPKKFEFFIRAAISSTAPEDLELTQDCFICVDSDNALPISDHECLCVNKEVHYGCFRQWHAANRTGKCPKCLSPYVLPENPLADEITGSAITGGELDNIKANVKKMERDITYLPGDPVNFVNAYAAVIRRLKITQEIDPPNFLKRKTYEMNMPKDSSSGLWFNDVVEQGVHVTRKPTKGQVHFAACNQVYCKLWDIRESLAARTFRPGEFANCMPTVQYSIAFKVEAKKLEEEAEYIKTKKGKRYAAPSQRSFFIPPGKKFFVDKIMLLPAHKRLYGRAWIMVGFKWQRGGARRLFRYLHGKLPGEKQTHYYMEWDLRGMDQSVKAIQIILNLCIMLLMFVGSLNNKYDMTDEIYTLQQMLFWSADNSAVHDVKWFGEYAWRRVTGILFSGEYFTSMSNTITSGVVFTAWLFCVRSQLVKYMEQFPVRAHLHERFLQALETYIEEFCAQMFGDDGLAAVPIALMKYLCLSRKVRSKAEGFVESYPFLKTFEDFLTEDCDMMLKLSDSAEFRHLLTEVEDDKLVKLGPKILKRHFIILETVTNGKVSTTIGAWRPCHVWKIALPTLAVMTYSQQVLRLVGHLWDTQGTNYRQYCMVMKQITWTLKKIPGATNMRNFVAYMKTLHDYHTMRHIRDLQNRMERLCGDGNFGDQFYEFLSELPSFPHLSHYFLAEDLSFHPPEPAYSWEDYQRMGKT